MTERSGGRRAPLLIAMLVVLAILVLVGGKSARVALAARDALTQVAATQVAVDALGEAPDFRGLRDVQAPLHASAKSLRGLQTELGPLSAVLRFTKKLPPQMSWPGEAVDVLELAAPLAEAGSSALDAIVDPSAASD